jgi:hypothetical protein
VIVWAIVLLVAGAAGFAFAHVKRREVHAMIGAETLAVADLTMFHRTALEVSGPGGFRKVCEVVGVTQPGPNGLLTAEFSRTPCVWHRHEVKRRYRHVSYDSQRRRQVSERTETVAQQVSSQAILLNDNTGYVYVDPRGLRGDAMEQVVSRFEPHVPQRGGPTVFGIQLPGFDRDDTIGFEYTEWVLRPGVRLYVHGEASDAGGSLMFGKPGAGGPFIVSARTEEELKKSSTQVQLFSAFGGLAAAVLGLVLLIVALVR